MRVVQLTPIVCWFGVAALSAPCVADGAPLERFRWIGLSVPIQAGPGAPRAAARWLTHQLHVEGLLAAGDSMVPLRVQPWRERTRVLLVQSTPGGVVEGGEAAMTLTGEGVLEAVLGQVSSAHDQPPVPTSAHGGLVGDAVLQLHPDGARWLIRDEVVSPGMPPMRRWRDANSGEILRLDPGIAHAPGRVFARDGAGPVVDVELAGLPPGARRLSGSRVGVDEPLRGPLWAADGDFRFDPHGADFEAFDHVNAYWHVDQFLGEELASMGGEAPSESIIVQLRMNLSPHVAVTSGRYVLLGRAIPGYTREPWRAGDLMRHEATHALLFDLGVTGASGDRESSAMHEGLADYLAAAATGDPAFGEWLYIGYPGGVTRVDQPAETFCYERYDLVAAGGVLPGSPWANGMIISGALWDLRGAIGRAADSLVLGAIRRLPPVPDFGDFAAALLETDWRDHDGRHAGAIHAAMVGRGILGRTGVEISGPLRVSVGESATFHAVRRVPAADAQTRWFTRKWCGMVPCSPAFTAAGVGPTLTIVAEGESEVLVQSERPGGALVTSQRLVTIAPPHAIDGPSRAARGDTLHYTARSRVGGIAAVRWTRRWARPGAVAEEIATGPEAIVVAHEPFRLEAWTAGDWRFPSALAIDVPVAAVVGLPSPEDAADRLVVRRQGRLRFECRIVLGASVSNALLEWFDVGGRRIGRMPLGLLASGEHVRALDLGQTRTGLHLLRLRTERGAVVRRLLVLD